MAKLRISVGDSLLRWCHATDFDRTGLLQVVHAGRTFNLTYDLAVTTLNITTAQPTSATVAETSSTTIVTVLRLHQWKHINRGMNTQ